nr:immunoglobulin heavy chain junction region [Macaca mulatta]MOY27953.1 immunoglobulin heavy chain junction region [Macaca mulatta]MOY29354.1 immunoglobulin heavy chain junction region [Macaca mulatta]
CARAVPADVW